MSCLKEFSPFEKNVSAHLKNKCSSMVSQRLLGGMSRNLITGIMFFSGSETSNLKYALQYLQKPPCIL